ncbi:cyclin-dependent kinase-like 2 [Rhopalosiphum padi]|uniref:cyclin-dependent kinase-like 2 n=1 Tax=Rhopalosiphum padi TaxID=40932 RepID=UPI00298E15FD|nr:cyclin-dependent kinase-like 2 [Rhopalosiphum padi]
MTSKIVNLQSNRYKPIEIIGQGSYGIVMKCKDRLTNEIVAIKKITDSYFYMPKVLREFMILKILNKHINVIRLLNIFRIKSFLYIVFPYMDYNICQYIDEYYPNGLGYDLTKKIMIQIINGIDYMHRNYVVHRDIKPENILITRNGLIKICDLGVSKMLCVQSFKAESIMTPDMGTIWYQSPEMLLGTQTYGPEIDVWSLGIVFIECMSGQPIITKETSIEQYQSIVKYFGVPITDQKYLNRKIKKISKVVSIKYFNYSTFKNVSMALNNYFPEWPIDLIEIVSKCLEFIPSRRKTTKSLLKTSYFVNGKCLKVFRDNLNNIL